MVKEYIIKRGLFIKALIFLSIFSYSNLFYRPSDLKKIFCLITIFFLLNFYSSRKYLISKLLYLLFLLVMFFKGSYNYFAENGIANLYILFIPVFFVIEIENSKIKEYIFTIWIALIFCIFFSIFNRILHFSLLNINISKKYYISSFGNPNFFSNSLILVGISSLIFFNKKKLFSVINFLILINLIVSIYISYYRNSTRASIVSLVFFVLIYIYISVLKKYKILSLLVILVICILFLYKFDYRDKGKLSNSDINRILMYETGIEQIRDNFLIGSGIYKFQQQYPYYQSLILQNDLYKKNFIKAKNAAHLHNDFLELTGKGGIIFSGIFIYILFILLYKSYLLKEKIIFSFFISYIIISIITFPLYINAIFLCFGFLGNYIINYKKQYVKNKINVLNFILFIFFVILISLFSINNSYKKLVLDDKEHNLDKGYIIKKLSCEVLDHFKNDIKFIRASIKRNGIRKSGYHNLGNYYLNKHDYIRAIFYYKQALRLNPNYIEVLNNIGQAYIYTYNFDRAIHIYKKALRYNGFLEDLYNGISVAYANKKEYLKGIKYLEAGLKISDNAVMVKNLAVLYKQIGADEKLIELIKREDKRIVKRKKLLSFLKTLVVVK